MTKNLSAISEMMEAINSLYQINRAFDLLAKHGLTSTTGNDIKHILELAHAELERLKAEK